MRNTFVEFTNSAADRWAAWTIATTVGAALLLALAGLLWLAIRRRVAPQVGYCLFLLVPLKLLVPVDVTVPAAIAQWTPSALVSTWFQGNRIADVDRHEIRRVKTQTAAGRRKIARAHVAAANVEPEMRKSPPVAVNFSERPLSTEPRPSRQAASTPVHCRCTPSLPVRHVLSIHGVAAIRLAGRDPVAAGEARAHAAADFPEKGSIPRSLSERVETVRRLA